ncbi:NAD(P)-dependent alcohol dehydrogenase [Aspergillus brunneoviolaceus CBS 621.78]|uniref:NAD(P)-binding protein n=1 Tax=Aspergillus brunneoviolaceus CBS 621.78 TaxID=1450534 RepID=A0ACD1G7X6_9EURO|nr:NAD(P)-binding protein [Aspergillus brunneoviolaceus CBS 621.78]RAH45339.1 NAD(P)-binding protein [Aspergillus brunneoviolaceus CBS 621.78]
MSASTMRAWVYTQSGLPSQTLRPTTTFPAPTPSSLGPTDLLIEVDYVSLNAICTTMMRALPPQPFSLGLPFRRRIAVPEFEFSGRILATGSQVPATRPELTPTARVAGCVSEQNVFGTGKGALAERLIAPASQVIALTSCPLPLQPSPSAQSPSQPETPPAPAPQPEPLSPLEASGLTACGCTAMQTLSLTGLIAGDKLLVNGGSTSVGMLTIQIARHILGPTGTIVATCSSRNAALVGSLGVDEVIDYVAHDPLHEHLRAHHSSSSSAAAKTRPFDAIIDCVGDATLYRHCAAYLAEGKPFINLGQMNAAPGFWGQLAWAWEQVALRFWPVVLGGVPRGYRFYSGRPRAEDMGRVLRLVERGVVRVVVDSVWGWGEVPQAYERMESKRARGKVVVRVRGEDA